MDHFEKLADDAWRGTLSQADWNRALNGTELIELPSGHTAYLASRYIVGNVSVFRTSDGLVMVDTGSPESAADILSEIRKWDESAVHTIVYTHGHMDHVCGAHLCDEEAVGKNRARPHVIAHANLPARFDRYQRSLAWNSKINQRQFRRGDLSKGWPSEYRYPDETYHESLDIVVGGETFELYHGKGETDDHTWIWAPQRKVIHSGDFVIWAAPNSGNPQKVQRYTREWAVALRAMMEKPAEILIPGHGPAVMGADRIQTLLDDLASFLESMHDQTLALMNDGYTLDEVVAKVEAPRDLLEKPYLRPTYDDPEFIVRNIWRFYGGWYDGNPAHLKPASDQDLSREIVRLAGGVEAIIRRIETLVAENQLRLASHFIQWAYSVDPDNPTIRALRSEVFRRRSQFESTLMARGIFGEVGDEE